MATAGLDGVVRTWCGQDGLFFFSPFLSLFPFLSLLSMNLGQLVSILEGPSESVDWIDWHPKGNVVVAGSSDSTCWMWKAKLGECLQVECDCVDCVLIHCCVNCEFRVGIRLFSVVSN